MNVLSYRKLCLSQMDQCVMTIRQVDTCSERDSLEDGGDIGWKMGSTHLEPLHLTDTAAITRTYTMVYKLRVASKCPCNCSYAKFQEPRCAACKCKGNDTKCGLVICVRTPVENNDCDKSDTGDSKQCLRCDLVTS